MNVPVLATVNVNAHEKVSFFAPGTFTSGFASLPPGFLSPARLLASPDSVPIGPFTTPESIYPIRSQPPQHRH